jgi:hypothetical protein
MKTKSMLLAGMLAIVAGAVYFAARESEPPAPQRSESVPPRVAAPLPAAESAAPARVPPFYASPEEARPFPRILSPDFFSHPKVARAYRVAQQIPGVLAQQPCYCWCDKFGHGSLLDCFATNHGAG